LYILDDFIRALGLPEPVVKEDSYRICEVEPMGAIELAAQVKERLSLASVRLAGDRECQVRRIGFPWGGVGLSLNARWIETCLELGAEALIAGETDDYTMRAMIDVGVPIIETSHAESENPGLRHFAEILQGCFLDVPVRFIECKRPWITL